MLARGTREPSEPRPSAVLRVLVPRTEVRRRKRNKNLYEIGFEVGV